MTNKVYKILPYVVLWRFGQFFQLYIDSIQVFIHEIPEPILYNFMFYQLLAQK